MTKVQTVEYFKMRLNNIDHPPTTRQQQAFETSIEAIEELWQYKSLGYTPEELEEIIKMVFNVESKATEKEAQG